VVDEPLSLSDLYAAASAHGDVGHALGKAVPEVDYLFRLAAVRPCPASEGYFDAEDRVVVPFRVHARGKESGIEVERRWAHIWTMRSGKVARFEVSLHPAETLKAVGLEK
jgi:ketosteroid isomerase-like protein